jgi:hypothetical protein
MSEDLRKTALSRLPGNAQEVREWDRNLSDDSGPYAANGAMLFLRRT